MDPVTARFGKRVKQLRVANAMTQEQLAKAAGLDTKHIGVIERGVKSSSFAAAARLAKALRVDVHELFLPDADSHPSSNPRPKSAGTTGFKKLPQRDLQAFVEDLWARLENLQK